MARCQNTFHGCKTKHILLTLNLGHYSRGIEFSNLDIGIVRVEKVEMPGYGLKCDGSCLEHFVYHLASQLSLSLSMWSRAPVSTKGGDVLKVVDR